VTVCAPAAKVEIEKLAVPPFNVPVPRAVDPSRNCTLPVAVLGVIFAVNVTACPAADGFGAELSATLEAAFTVTVCTPDELAALLASPP
jgi:hypothetical protein